MLRNIDLQRIAGKVTAMHGQVLHQPVLQINEDNIFEWSKNNYRIFLTFHLAAVFYKHKLREVIANDQQILNK